MNDKSISAPVSEQKICVECGMCCDGTLFRHAHLSDGERGHLPEKIERNSYTKDGKDYFRLPCEYFDSKCTIYGQQRADICSGYRCMLLFNFAAGKITLDDALETVRTAVRFRAEIFEEYRNLTGSTDSIYFKKMLREMGKIEESSARENIAGKELDILLARCNIFEALLLKHFWAADEFDKMIVTR